ncbi:MAG: hypothetical protein RBQ91_00035 [Acholeplasma sp.]|nr:hypothetical protein [Acholeplasma sp.]
MKKFQDVFSAVFKSYFRFTYYDIFPLWMKIILMVLLLPLHVIFIFLSMVFIVVYFIIEMSRIPVEYIKSTIEEHKDDHPAPQVVVYLVSYPTKFLFDLLTSFGIVFLAWVFLLIQVIGYLGSLGNMYFQPFMVHAKEEASKPKTNYKLSKNAIIVIIVTFTAIVVTTLGFVFIPKLLPDNQIDEDAVAYISDFLVDNNMEDGFVIEAAYGDYEDDVYYIVVVHDGFRNYYYVSANFRTNTTKERVLEAEESEHYKSINVAKLTKAINKTIND